MSIEGLDEGREFTAADVGNFLQKAFGDRLSGDGKAWDTEGVQVSLNQETGKVEISNLNPEQYGPKWINGEQRSWALSELLFLQGFRPYYSSQRLNAEIPLAAFENPNPRSSVPDFANAGTAAAELNGEMAKTVELAMDEVGFPIG
ncbi:MAG: hypothetical protein NTZ25_05650 [Candidatus Peregrinibacteria bacterium]|nr:hypothetical protein [Candidatus Peregrinibacteria bacterium]